MRIGIDASCLPGLVAGAGRYVIGLVRGLAEISSAHEFFVYCKNRDAALFSDLPPNFHLRRLPDFDLGRRLAWQLGGLREALHRDGIDVWHATHYVIPFLSLHAKIVVTFHDLGFYRFPQFYARHKVWFFRRAMQAAARRADAIIAVSESTRDDIILQFGRKDGVFSIHSGLSPIFLQSKNGSAPPHPRPYLLAVATQEKRKNLPFLISAFSALAGGFPHHDLILVGHSENDTRRIQQTISRHGLETRVMCTGYVSEELLLRYYRHSALYCQPAHYEGFGFPVLEALACGSPVLAADRPAINEIADGHAVLVPASDAPAWTREMAELLSRRETFPTAARLYARGFTWRRTAQQTLAVYESVVQGKGCRPPTVQSNRFSTRTERISGPSQLESAILKTLAFADQFEYPLKPKELHRGLLETRAVYSQVAKAVDRLSAAGVIGEKSGYCFLPGREGTVAVRRRREAATRELLRRNRRWLRRIARFPWVKGLALSGSAAFGNCEPGADLDLMLITEPRRLWLVYAGLAVALKLARKRNLFCLNYLIAERAAEPIERNFYTAHQIAHLRPLGGPEAVREYIGKHEWVNRFLPQGGIPFPIVFELPASPARRPRKNTLLDLLDELAYRLYGRRIRRLTRHLDPGSIVVQRDVIQLFTNNHRNGIMQRFRADCRKVDEEKTVQGGV